MAGGDVDGNRDCVSGVRVNSLEGENRDIVPANKRRGKGVVHSQCSWPGIETDNEICVHGRSYHRRQRP